jgi:hypothetical protein
LVRALALVGLISTMLEKDMIRGTRWILGDVDRAIRAALVGLWVPPADAEQRAVPRWNRSAPKFEQVSKQAAAGEG